MIATLIKVTSFGFGRLLFRNRTTSAITAVVIIMLVLFGWHKLDKSSAVRAAVMKYVADVELTAARAQIAEANRRAAVAAAATSQLQERVQVAEGEALRVTLETEQYEAKNEIPTSCRVDSGIFDRLRGN